jgi:hypothetical protein
MSEWKRVDVLQQGQGGCKLRTLGERGLRRAQQLAKTAEMR